jgi:sterol desaturase/sphingolipid hydroxylase (fatty acid hydroxylase superfamily)
MILTLIFGFYLHNLTEYFFHRMGHQAHQYNFIYRLHKDHHLNYPITNLTSDKYKGRKEGVIAYSIPSFIVIYSLYCLFDPKTFKILTLQLAFMTYFSDLIHTQFHLKDSYLSKYEWFRERQRLHFIHHRRLNKNFSFAGISYAGDNLMNTLEERNSGLVKIR